jgi:hypothetical protein
VIPASPWYFVALDPLLGPGYTVSEILEKVLGSVTVGLGLVLLLLLFWSLLRRQWLAAAALVALTSAQALFFSDAPWWIVGVAAVILRAIPVFLALRFGVLATVSAFVVITLLCEMPITSDLTSWAGVPAVASFALVAALAVYGFRTATGGRGLNFGLGD